MDKKVARAKALSLPIKLGVCDALPPQHPREFRLFGLQIETALIRQS